MGQLRALVRAHALVAEDPAQVLGQTESVARNIDSAVCATLNYVRVEPRSGEFHFSSAGHPPPLVVRGNGESSFLTSGRRPALAALPDPPANVGSDRLSPGDLLVLYTDGLIEQPGESLDVGFDRLVQEASSLVDGPADQVAGRLVDAMVPNGAQRDDICVLALRQS
jgi:serine phosphatase RsbU (regulator of sigma subunit)